jgi:hypothetical protein
MRVYYRRLTRWRPRRTRLLDVVMTVARTGGRAVIGPNAAVAASRIAADDRDVSATRQHSSGLTERRAAGDVIPGRSGVSP